MLTAEAKHKLIESHLPIADKLARRAAKRFAGSVEYDDLLSGAFLGLMDAADRYDPTAHATKFSSFAGHRIQGAIIDEARRLSERTRGEAESVRELERVKAAHYASTGDRLCDDEVVLPSMGKHGHPPSHALARAGRKVERIDGMRLSKSGESVTLPTVPGPEPDDIIDAVTRGMSRIDRAIVVLMYRDGLTQAATAKMIGISFSRVSQRRIDIMARLRTNPAALAALEAAGRASKWATRTASDGVTRMSRTAGGEAA